MSEYYRHLGVILVCEMVKEVIYHGALHIRIYIDDLQSQYGAL